MSRRASSTESGFNLLELTISLVVSVVLLAAVVQAYRVSSQLANTSLTLGQIDEAANQAIQSISSELRWAQPNTLLITTENGASRIDFVVPEGFDGSATIWSSPVTIRYVPSTIDSDRNGIADEGVLVRTQDGRERRICRQVRLGGFTIKRDIDILRAQLTLFAVDRQRRVTDRQTEVSISLVNRP